MFNIWINDGSTEMPTDDILYIISKEGIFLKKKLGLFESIAPVENISILNEMGSYAALDIKKIPMRDFGSILSFVREVYSTYHSEANTILHYHPDRRVFRVEVPNQEVSHGGVNYESDLQYDGYLRIGTIHSHCDFGAFHSGTDKDDEETWDGLHITVGHVNSNELTITASIVANGSRFWINPCDYINGIEMIEVSVSKWGKESDEIRYIFKGSSRQLKFPKEWMDNVNKKTYTPITGKHSMFDRVMGRSLFDGVGNTLFDPTIHKSGFTYTDLVRGFGDEEFNPCMECPYKEYKVELQMEELLNEADDDELDRLGFTEIGSDDGSELDEHKDQEGYKP